MGNGKWGIVTGSGEWETADRKPGTGNEEYRSKNGADSEFLRVGDFIPYPF